MSERTGVRRYSLVVPEDLFQQVEEIAERKATTVVDILRRFIKIGLLASEIEESPDARLIIREGDREREIVLL